LAEDQTGGKDEEDLVRTAAKWAKPLMAVRTSAAASVPPFLSQGYALWEFTGPTSDDEEQLDMLAEQLKAICRR
jgi:hypothetical protein